MALGDRLILLSHNPCVDAMLHTKADAIPLIAGNVGLSLEDFVRETAVVDDGDTTFLTDPAWSGKYALIAAPANAGEKVKAAVAARPNGFVAAGSGIDGFFAAYWRAAKRGARFVVTDRDGVLRLGDAESGDRFYEGIARNMGGMGLPTVIVLTGSSYEQNAAARRDPVTKEQTPSFIDAYGFSRVERVPTPYLVVAENGGLAINAFDVKDTRNLVEGHNPEMMRLLMGEFRGEVLFRVNKEVAPRFGFGRARHEKDQDGNIYVPDKFTMVTVNCPRSVGGDKGWRATPESDAYRAQVLDIMVGTAEKLGMPYRIVGR